MPDWDADSPALRRNLTDLLRQIRDEALQRRELSLATIRQWHKRALKGLTVPDQSMVGHFRGEPGLENVEVQIGMYYGVSATDVAAALEGFENTLKRVVARLDQVISVGSALSVDQLAAVLDVCAWAHAEWVRIHPFANGNGRTARLLSNSLAMRYGLPPFVRLRPRPDGDYAASGESAMRGDWKPTSLVFREMLDDLLSKP